MPPINGTSPFTQYICIGDSTRSSNGAYAFEQISNTLNTFGVTSRINGGFNGLKCEHWAKISNCQPGLPTVDTTIGQINGDGSKTLVEISLGINDIAAGATLASWLQTGISLLLASRPNTTVICTKANITTDTTINNKIETAYNTLTSGYKYPLIDIHNNVFDSWYDSQYSSNNYYFIDGVHPNKYGQFKMGDYVVDQLVNNNLLYFSSTLAGTIDPKDPNYSALSSAGLRVELIQKAGTALTNLYIVKVSGNWYLYCTTSSSYSISHALQNTAGRFVATKAAWALDSSLAFDCVYTIANATPLINFTQELVWVKLTTSALVDEFTR